MALAHLASENLFFHIHEHPGLFFLQLLLVFLQLLKPTLLQFDSCRLLHRFQDQIKVPVWLSILVYQLD